MIDLKLLLEVFNQDLFLIAASLLLLGFTFGWLGKKFKLPRITGYIIAGIIFGPSLLNILQEHSLTQLDFIPKFALGIIALVIGAGLSFKLIKRLGFKLVLITLLESLGAFFLVAIGLSYLKVPLGAILPLAAIASATAPAATVAIIREYHARGPLTETTLAVVALDDAIAIILFGLILTFDLHHLSAMGKNAMISLSISFSEILVAMIIGVGLGFIANFLIKLSKEISDTLIITLGIIFFAIGIASISNVSPLLTNMFLGLTLINISSKNTEIIANLEKMTPPIYCFFFVLAGAHLNIMACTTVGWQLLIWTAIFILARMFGKVGGAYLGGMLTNVPENIKKYLGFTLIPEAGVAIGLSLLISKGSLYFEYRSIIINVTLMAVAFNEIVGPLFTKYALFKTKEASVE